MPEEENPVEPLDPPSVPGSPDRPAMPRKDSRDATDRSEAIRAAHHHASDFPEEAPMPGAGGNIEAIHHSQESRGGAEAAPSDIIARIERLENWVAANRLA